jgi:hypothetical protein
MVVAVLRLGVTPLPVTMFGVIVPAFSVASAIDMRGLL